LLVKKKLFGSFKTFSVINYLFFGINKEILQCLSVIKAPIICTQKLIKFTMAHLSLTILWIVKIKHVDWLENWRQNMSSSDLQLQKLKKSRQSHSMDSKHSLLSTIYFSALKRSFCEVYLSSRLLSFAKKLIKLTMAHLLFIKFWNANGLLCF